MADGAGAVAPGPWAPPNGWEVLGASTAVDDPKDRAINIISVAHGMPLEIFILTPSVL